LTTVLQVEEIHPDDNVVTVSRYLVAYLLWLFGWIKFYNAHDNMADKVLLPYAYVFANAQEEEVLGWR
jgi:hypothetical protein